MKKVAILLLLIMLFTTSCKTEYENINGTNNINNDIIKSQKENNYNTEKKQEENNNMSHVNDGYTTKNTLDISSEDDVFNYLENSNGNIANYGIATKEGEWIYFSSSEEGLLRIKEDASKKELIYTSKAVYYINVIDNWIYFVDIERNLYKIKVDGNEIEMLAEGDISNVCIIDNWLYYTNHDVEENKIFKMKNDSSEFSEIVLSNSPSFFSIKGEWIYYVTSDYTGESNRFENSIYKIKKDGIGETKICSDIEIDSGINILGNWIYYINKGDESSIYKMKLDGSENMKLNNNRSSYINVENEWIYYIEIEFLGGEYYYYLCRIKTDGSSKTIIAKIDDSTINYINLIDDWIYYVRSEWLGKTYRIKKDGSEDMRLSLTDFDISWRAREKEFETGVDSNNYIWQEQKEN
ncbi:UNVERIFIED_CONTAM: uncharacterized protein DUF5050 [Acetivibrio alkalicellulosi]